MNKRLSLFLLIISVGLLTALAAGPVFGGGQGQGKGEEARQNVERAVAGNEKIAAVALGRDAAGADVVLVYTTESGVRGIPAKDGDVEVVVRVSGKIFASPPRARSDRDGANSHASTLSTLAPTDNFVRPVPIGVSSGTERLIKWRGRWYCTVGTLAARVTDGTNVWALSNNHVYALENSGEIGDSILQPGRVDLSSGCGTSGEIAAAHIGNLADFKPIVFSRNASNTIDAAIASTTTADVGYATPAADGVNGYGTPSSTTIAAAVDQPVQKYGRTTGHTFGTITGINATVFIGYDEGTARFVNQIIIAPGDFSDSGDSGSLIVTDDVYKNPVGLLFAGSSSITIANPIDLVLDEFGVTIDGDGVAPPPPASTPGITVDPITGLTTTESGGQATFDVVLDTQPTHDVTIGLSSTKPSEGTVNKASLTFTAADWDTSQMVTVTGVDDGDNVDGDVAYMIVNAAAVSADSDYSEVDPADVSVTNTDNDSPAGSDYMYVSAIDMFYKDKGKGELITTITIWDDSGPVSGATVYGTLSRDIVIWDGTLNTNSDGKALLKLKFPISGVTYKMCVTDVKHSHTYENIETCETKTIP